MEEACHKEQVETANSPRSMIQTEYIDEQGHNFIVSYSQATMNRKDKLWIKAAVTVASLREKANHETQDLSLTEAEMKVVDLQSFALMLPTLLD